MKEKFLEILNKYKVYSTILEESFEEVVDELVIEAKKDLGENYVNSKTENIEYIKDFIKKNGETSCYELNAECSPCINVIQETSVLVEKFFENKVEVCTYVGSMEVYSSFVEYEELSEEVLRDIVNIIDDSIN